MNRFITIITDEQFYNCLQSQVEIEVRVAGQLDYVGVITGFTDEAVRVKEGTYLRTYCKVSTSENYFRAWCALEIKVGR